MKTSRIPQALSGALIALLFMLSVQPALSQDKNVGDYLGEYMSVPAKSNGEYTAFTTASLTLAPWQCVEYVKRFYDDVFNIGIGQVGTAEQMYDKALSEWSSDFFAYPNLTNNVPPLTGDILCFDGAGVGHVAIVYSVDLKGGKLWVIEQNWSRNECFRWLNFTKDTNGKYSVTFPYDSDYYVEGWVRAKSMVIGQYENDPKWRQAESQAIADAYNRNGGLATLRNPHDNGAGIYVHTWQPGTHNFLVQNLNGGNWGPGAIVMWPTWDKAYSLHGAFWWYFWYHNVLDGLPISDEYRSGNDVYQDFEDGKTYYWNITWQTSHAVEVLNTTDVHARVHISLTPTFTAYALSDTQAFVSAGPVSGGVTYRVLRDGNQVGTLNMSYNFTDSGLLANTSYSYELVVVDGSGNVLVQYGPTVVTTNAAPAPPSVPLVDFEYWMRTRGFEIGVPTYSGATTASIVVGSQNYQATPNTFYTVSNLDNGTYSVHVELFNGSGTLIAASVSKTITVGNMISVIVNGTSHIGPNGSGVGRFIVSNGFSSPLYDWQYRSVSSNDTWVILNSDTFPSPGTVPAYGSVTIEVPFTTLDYWNAVGSSTISIWAQAKCDSSGRPFVQISGHYTVAVEPFKDLWLALPPTLPSVAAGQPASITPTISNEGNQTIPPTRLWIYVDDTLVVDVLVPQLASRELWQPNLALGSFPEAGTHEITVVVDPLNEVAEAIEDTTTITEQGIVDQQAYVLYPTADTRIYLNSGQTSVVDPSEDILRVSTRPQNSLLAFDLPAIPSGYEVEAELQLYLPSASEYNADSWLYVEPLTQAWDQSTVNWYSFSTPGGTYAGTGASLLVPAHGTGSYDQWLTFDLTADVWNQLNGTAPNCGFVVWMAENPSASGNNTLFIASSENQNQELWPRLVISASLPGEVTRTIQTNNIAVRSLVVTPPPQPNFLIQNVTVSPSDPTTEDQLNLDVTVKNTGAETAPGNQLEVDSTDALVAPVTDNIPSLPAGASTTVTIEHPAVNSGIVGFNVTADAQQAVTETDEADNDDYVMLVVSEPGLTPTVTPTPSPTPTVTVEPTPTATPTPTYVLQTFTLIADRATRIYGAGIIDPNENNVRTQQSGMVQRALVGFTPPSLPAGFQVTSATLRLYLISQRGYVSNGVTVYRLTRNWDEAATNWYQASAGQAWTNEGGDYATTGSAYRWIPAKGENTTGLYSEWQAWNVTTIVNAWQSGQPNDGLMLIQDENVSSGDIQQLLFGSDEAENPSYIPQLVIEGYVP